jgi:hypothetical protein
LETEGQTPLEPSPEDTELAEEGIVAFAAASRPCHEWMRGNRETGLAWMSCDTRSMKLSPTSSAVHNRHLIEDYITLLSRYLHNHRLAWDEASGEIQAQPPWARDPVRPTLIRPPLYICFASFFFPLVDGDGWMNRRSWREIYVPTGNLVRVDAGNYRG